MIDDISSDSKQDFIYASFNQINADTLITIKDQDDKIIAAFKTSRNIKSLLYSKSDLDFKSYKIYTGGEIDGEESNGLYTKINSYNGGEEIRYRDSSSNNISNGSLSDTVLKVLFVEIGLLFLVLAYYIIDKKIKY